MFTEEEAKTKWCAHAIASHTNPRGKARWDENGNEVTEDRFSHNCIGSACMAWRWEPGAFYSSYSDKMVVTKNGSAKPAEGYCGLAGKP